METNQHKLFADEFLFEENLDPVDDTEIKMTLLYYSVDELKLWRATHKKLMKMLMPIEKAVHSNIPDVQLEFLHNCVNDPEIMKIYLKKYPYGEANLLQTQNDIEGRQQVENGLFK